MKIKLVHDLYASGKDTEHEIDWPYPPKYISYKNVMYKREGAVDNVITYSRVIAFYVGNNESKG